MGSRDWLTLDAAWNHCAPDWLVRLIGIDYFYHVTTASISQLPGGTEMLSVGRLDDHGRRKSTCGLVINRHTGRVVSAFLGLSRLSRNRIHWS